ncbi:MAG TPA: site-2 protease family protein [Terriglobia bacterium]|nr:site-2 protease family protein [Terriglobia bacterium]
MRAASYVPMGEAPASSDFRPAAVLDRPILVSRRRAWWRWRPAWRFQAPAWTSSFPFHLALLAATVLTTLIVGAQMAANYAAGRPAFDLDLSWSFLLGIGHNPFLLLSGLPFSGTLLGILFAHELGHYLTARAYGLRVSYPYFIPAPTLIGTLGAFIRIREPIHTRRMLFDVAVAGPLAGFVLAIPALTAAILRSRVGTVAPVPDMIIPGHPLALTLLAHWTRPGVPVSHLVLTPAGCAAWVGLFATALNLLPISQLDGGHLLYAVFERRHRAVARVLWITLFPLGYFCWTGWFFWAVLIAFIRIKHPPVAFPTDGLGRARLVLAVLAVAILALCFMPTPFSIR